MRKFNLSTWAIQHPSLMLYAMIMLTLIGVLSYGKLGQSEDPPFTFKIMIVRTHWPGASAHEIEQQVTDKLEKKLQEVPWLDNLRSFSRPGESVIYVVAKDYTPPSEIPTVWYQARKKIEDIKHTLPHGVEGPFFNDEFGDVYGNLYALTGDGYDFAELKRQAEAVRGVLLRITDVAKVDFFGEQKQRIYINFSNAKLATLGIDKEIFLKTLVGQNLITSGGFFESSEERIRIAISGRYDQVEQIRDIRLYANNREFRLGDLANVNRGFEDPPNNPIRYKGENTLLIGVAMQNKGDIVKLGNNLDLAIVNIQKQLPVGLELHAISSQHRAVQQSIQEFIRSLAEAIVIVLLVSLMSLGFRTGIVVAIAIPIVLAITFWFMYLLNVGLQKVSLGALILALGLLVDDAIIAAEMMASKMEEGWERARAAAYAFTSTAMPMLSGTLVTAAGFLPIATAASSTGEYTYSMFQVIVIALLVSWIVAVVFVPYLGNHLLPDYGGKNNQAEYKKNRLTDILPKFKKRLNIQKDQIIYYTPFYRFFRRVVIACVTFRWVVIITTIILFTVSLFSFGLIEKQFFPDSTRPELLVNLYLAEGSSYAATDNEVRKLEDWLSKQQNIENYVAYIGNGSPRFYLPIVQQLPRRSFAEIVILTPNIQQREELRGQLIKLFEEDFISLRASVLRLENGPPVGFPVQFRVSGHEHNQIREISHQVADIMRNNQNLSNVQLDWDELTKVIRININQSKARLLGISSNDIANIVNGALQGLYVTEFREGVEQIDV
ncbi:efflux RND transporter permease subunit [Nitrosomonas sp. wSCUT-2]